MTSRSTNKCTEDGVRGGWGVCVWRIGGGVEGCDADTQTVALLALRVMATVGIGAKMEGSPVPWEKKEKKRVAIKET